MIYKLAQLLTCNEVQNEKKNITFKYFTIP